MLNMIDKKKFTERLSVLMGHLKANAFATTCDVDPKTIRKAMKGEVPGIQTLEKITNKHDATIGWLLGETDQRGNILKTETAENIYELGNNLDKYKKLEEGILEEAQAWLDHIEQIRPGQKIWFRLEFENRFPEFAEWKQKKRAGNDH